MQLLGISEKREALTEAAKVLEVPALDFSSLETTGKELAQHKSKWDSLGDFRDDRVAWMTQSVCSQSHCHLFSHAVSLCAACSTPRILRGVHVFIYGVP